MCVCTEVALHHASLQSLRDSLWKAKDESAEGAKIWQTKLKEAHQKSEVGRELVILTGSLPTMCCIHTASLNPLLCL